MKKCYVIIFILVGWAGSVAAQREIYTHPEFVNYAARHTSIAVLPFKVSLTLRPKEMKSITPEQLATMQESDGETVQRALYTYLLERKEKGQLFLQLKDVAQTNAILRQNGITQATLSNYTPQQIAQILGVDAVMGGKVTTSKPMSDGAAVAVGMLVGFWGATNNGSTTIEIHEAEKGELIWSYQKELSRALGSDTYSVYRTLMRKATKTLPYLDPNSGN